MGLEEDWESAAPAASATATAPQPSLQQEFEQAGPGPSMGEVALNAIPKGIANLLNTPEFIGHIMSKGLLYIPGAEHIPGIKASAEKMSNTPMDLAMKAGLVNPLNEPQTPAQRIVDTAIQAAVGAAAMPVGGVVTALKGAAIGATSGAAAQTTKELTGSDLLAMAVGMITPFAISGIGKSAAANLGTSIRKDTLKEARSVGYVVEPSSVKPSAVVGKLENVAGKAAVAQDATVRNQAVTNGLAAKSIGLPEDTPLSMPVLEEVRKRAAAPYEEVEALRASATDLPWFSRYHSQNLMDELKQARSDTSALYRQYHTSQTPSVDMLKAAEASAKNVESIENDIEMIAKAAGKPELVKQLAASRQLFARTYDVEKALNVGSGNISAPIIGRMLDKDRPLSGELKIIGKFAQAFPRVAREADNVPPPSVSGVDAASSALLGVAGVGAAGPAGAIAAGAPLLRGPARNIVLSNKVQNALTNEPAQPTPLSTTIPRSAAIGEEVGSQP